MSVPKPRNYKIQPQHLDRTQHHTSSYIMNDEIGWYDCWVMHMEDWRLYFWRCPSDHGCEWDAIRSNRMISLFSLSLSRERSSLILTAGIAIQGWHAIIRTSPLYRPTPPLPSSSPLVAFIEVSVAALVASSRNCSNLPTCSSLNTMSVEMSFPK